VTVFDQVLNQKTNPNQQKKNSAPTAQTGNFLLSLSIDPAGVPFIDKIFIQINAPEIRINQKNRRLYPHSNDKELLSKQEK